MTTETTARATSYEGAKEEALPSRYAETYERLLTDARALLPDADALVFFTGGAASGLRAASGWFATADLRLALTAGPERTGWAREGLAELVHERGRPLLLPRLDAWEAAAELRAALVAALGEAKGLSVWRAVEQASLVASPIRTAVGHSIGVVAAASLDPDRLDAAALRTMEVVADLSALALERVELLDAEARRAREELRLKRATESISGSLEPTLVYRGIVERAVELTGASKALLTGLDPQERSLHPAATVGFSEGFATRRLPLESGTLGRVARRRTPYLSSMTDEDEWDHSVTETEGIRSFMHAPIEFGPRLYGVLTVAHEEEEHFSQTSLELLVRLARSSAAAIANALDFERERRIARALTAGFVPESLPELPGFETGLLYEPSADAPTGGDLYGAWHLPGGGVAVLVGDVAGKGVEMAGLSSMARFFIEARSWESARPAAVLEQANEMLMERLPSDTFVTALLGVLSGDELRWSNAGHHPPLLVARGEATPLPGHGLPLGIESGAEYGHDAVRLEPGNLVFAYTDGLIEARRDGGEIYGQERLAAFVAQEAHRPAPELVRAAHSAARSYAGGLSDDTVVLALRRTG